MRIAVLLTCHNRVEKTLSFLRSLVEVKRPEGCGLEVFLTDDGSTDGTGDRVRALGNTMPTGLSVAVVEGSGNDFWCGGMRRAWRAAVESGKNYDFFLWANDDVELYPDALTELLEIAKSQNQAGLGVVCGCFCDPDTGEFTYGGRDEKRLLLPDGTPQKCRYIHGNTVLVPKSTYERIGMFDDRWTHGFGDTDYGLMCIKAGLSCLTTTKYIGTCRQHAIKAPWFSSEVPFRCRWELMWKPVGGSFREFVIFRRKHYPYRWPLDAVKFFVQVLFPWVLELLRRGVRAS